MVVLKIELLDLLDCNENNGMKLIENVFTGKSRWQDHYRMVFSFKDKFYATRYSKGSTENQDCRPFELEGDAIECVEVKPVNKTITVYESENK